jgi:hypothetical protein
MILGNDGTHMFAEHRPTTSVVMQPEKSIESLDMVVDEGMIKLGKGFLQSLGCDAVPRKKLEIHAS